ncbi:MAG: acetyl-CoA carboxylase, biotin carboxyl carrier protein [Rhodospirillaceae bacterium]|nr:acetyl-CoA carboxylase, biotin carboxyl carrier protein [Rhodospirillaceae bacterium]
MAHDVDSKLVRKLAKLLEETGLGELEYATDDWRIRVARPMPSVLGAATTPALTTTIMTPAANHPAADLPGSLVSPMVGIAYLAPDPKSPPFVSIGSTVSEGETVMIIEAMKVMNTIPAHRSGTVAEILIESGQPVEFGQALLVIE